MQKRRLSVLKGTIHVANIEMIKVDNHIITKTQDTSKKSQEKSLKKNRSIIFHPLSQGF